MTRITYFHEEKCFLGSSVKCVDAFRIAINEKKRSDSLNKNMA